MTGTKRRMQRLSIAHVVRHGHRTKKDIAREMRIIPIINCGCRKNKETPIVKLKGAMLWMAITEELELRAGMFGLVLSSETKRWDCRQKEMKVIGKDRSRSSEPFAPNFGKKSTIFALIFGIRAVNRMFLLGKLSLKQKKSYKNATIKIICGIFVPIFKELYE